MHVQVEKDDPGDNDGQAPFGTLEFGADMMDRSRVVRVNIELDMLEMGGIVEHVEYQTKGENRIQQMGTETRQSRTSW